jgi:DNA ligase (NAD+)
MNQIRVHELERLILHHKELYYGGRPEISDEKYDKLEAELKKIDPGNPVLSIVGFDSKEATNKVSHQKKMLSLDKTYSEDELAKWIEKESVVSVFKIDGSSCSLIYENGHLVMAKTRGDGVQGENIFKKTLFINDIPKSLSAKESLEIRGEIYCVESQFIHLSQEMKALDLEAPTSQRNIVAGLLGRKENVQLARFLSFKAFDVIVEGKFKREHEKLDKLKALGFDIPEYEIHNSAHEVQGRIKEARDFISKGDYLIDGLVFIYDDLKMHEELGETSHHPRYKIAFKFAGDTKTTKINDIEWGVSRNGRLTPVAIVEPVELSGAMIGRVTLHNFGMVRSFELKKGDTIEIIRSGEVIPKFLGVSEKSEGKFSYPETCPSCHTALSIEDIWLNCPNDLCPAKVHEEILHYIHRASIDDLSDKRLQEMVTRGLVGHIPDLYRLKIDDLLLLDKVKEKMATKMHENIQKTKVLTLSQFIAAIGIDGVSLAKTEKIIAQGYNTLDKILELTLENMLVIEGFAEKSSTDFLSSLNRKRNLIEELVSVGVKVKADEIATGEGPLAGLKFCITGELSSSRAEVEKRIKQNGGVMVSSVSKNTSYLLTNETESTSSKFVKAMALNVPVIDESGLEKLLRG